mmetsp:Transcript_38905/g.117013  ORF Transcript_38905/g.117013 Transcript_38905/m.117013 type:complete len:722 (-) Transcript_38905:426-2591(-)
MSKPIGSARGHPDDSDLEDLLASKTGGGAGTDNVQINLDHLTRDDPRVAAPASYDKRYQKYYGAPVGVCAIIYAHLCLFFSHRPAAGLLCTIMGIAGLAYLFVYIVDPTGKVGEVKHDWTAVTSELDLKAGDIDHWCIGGGDTHCRCDDPLIPAGRGEFKSWVTAHKQNKEAIKPYLNDWENPEESKIDVAFLGESLIEEMDGRWLGMTKGEHLEDLAKLYKTHFSKEKGGAVEGVALGIAGDTAPNVLFRLLHGEMPYEFNPKVWWVSLGMNDLARMQCSEEVVIMGIIRVVEEIRRQKPNAKIVIDSLLPMHDFRSGPYPQQTDYRDAFRKDITSNRNRGWGRGRPHPAVRDSYIAHNPNKPKKEIQGEAEEGVGGGVPGRGSLNPRTDRFPGGKRRLLSNDGERKSGEHEDDTRFPLGRDLRKKQLSPEEIQEREKAMREAAMAKQRAKLEQLLAQRVKHDKVNPVLRNKPTYKKFDPKKMFMRKTQIPLWPAITVINNALRKFADKHDHVSFFDSTYLFTARDGPRSFTLLSDMISPRGHPTDAGFQRWETAVANKLHNILDVKPAEKAAEKAAAAGFQSQTQTQKQQQDEDNEEDSESESKEDEGVSETGEDSEDEDDDESEEEEEEEDEDEEKNEEKSEDEEKWNSAKEEEVPVSKKELTVKSPTKVASVERSKAPAKIGKEEEVEPVKKKTSTKKTSTIKKPTAKETNHVSDDE